MVHDMENPVVVQFFANSRFFVCFIFTISSISFQEYRIQLLIGTASIEESEAEFVDDIAQFIIVS